MQNDSLRILKTALKVLLLPMMLVLAGCSETLTGDRGLQATTSAPQSQRAASMVSIDPIVGIPQTEAAPLISALQASASGQGITVGVGEQSASYIYKGYISSIPGSGGNTIIHVWDLFDAQGNRVHRVNGTVPVAAAGVEGALEQVGQEAAAGLASFMRSARS